MTNSMPTKFAILHLHLARVSKTLGTLGLTAAFAFGGTVSPQLRNMDPNQQVQVIVRHHDASLLGTLCSGLNLIDVLPGGELCSMTVTNALSLAKDPRVGHVSVNNSLLGTGSALPVYDYTPQTIQPSSSTTGSANPNPGQNIGVAVIDSGISINLDLIGNGSGGARKHLSRGAGRPKFF